MKEDKRVEKWMEIGETEGKLEIVGVYDGCKVLLLQISPSPSFQIEVFKVKLRQNRPRVD
jgi:hypothetical protein